MMIVEQYNDRRNQIMMANDPKLKNYPIYKSQPFIVIAATKDRKEHQKRLIQMNE